MVIVSQKGDFYETANTKISACHPCTGIIPVPYYRLLTFPNSTPEAEKNTVLETTAKAAGNGSLEDPTDQPDKTALLAAQKAFDQFTENLFKQEAAQSLLTLHYTLADPESYGITDYDRTLGTALAEDTQRDMEDAKQVKADLDAMDTRLLSKDQLLTYTILSSYINTLLSSDGLELYDQPLSTTLGIQSQLPILLSEYTFYKKQDIDDYLSLLSSIDTYYDSLIAFETQRAQAGLGLCDTVIDNIIRSCNAYLIDADHSFLAETFASRLNEIDGLSDQEKADYKAKNKKAIDEHFVPAYERLITGLEGLKGKGTNDKGLYYYPEGRKYYEYLVNASTGTSYSDVPALKQAINKQMTKELTAVNQLLNDDPSLGDKLDTSTFTLTKPQDILEDLKAQCQTDFPPVNDCNYTIKTVPKTLEGFLSPAFYLKVPIDRPRIIPFTSITKVQIPIPSTPLWHTKVIRDICTRPFILTRKTPVTCGMSLISRATQKVGELMRNIMLLI